jgi:hypothetical protein
MVPGPGAYYVNYDLKLPNGKKKGIVEPLKEKSREDDEDSPRTKKTIAKYAHD